jgi:uncharacterized protein YgbK (DUF1537 family)
VLAMKWWDPEPHMRVVRASQTGTLMGCSRLARALRVQDVHADELLVALVHVRPSAIDEDATERQQRDAVVTLLVRAPLPAGAAAIRVDLTLRVAVHVAPFHLVPRSS